MSLKTKISEGKQGVGCGKMGGGRVLKKRRFGAWFTLYLGRGDRMQKKASLQKQAKGITCDLERCERVGKE